MRNLSAFPVKICLCRFSPTPAAWFLHRTPLNTFFLLDIHRQLKSYLVAPNSCPQLESFLPALLVLAHRAICQDGWR